MSTNTSFNELVKTTPPHTFYRWEDRAWEVRWSVRGPEDRGGSAVCATGTSHSVDHSDTGLLHPVFLMNSEWVKPSGDSIDSWLTPPFPPYQTVCISQDISSPRSSGCISSSQYLAAGHAGGRQSDGVERAQALAFWVQNLTLSLRSMA